MTKVSIRVDGMDELRANLKKIDKGLGKELGKTNKEIGHKVVGWAEGRRSTMATQFPAYRSKAVKIKPSANQRRVEISVRPQAAERGTDRHPVFGTWLAQSSFNKKVWPEPSRDGWLVRPTAFDRERDIADEYLDAVSSLVRRHLQR